MLDSPENRELIISAFPNLKTDPLFTVTSPQDPNYNCIAWTGFKTDVWWEACPNIPFIFDGVKYDWPLGALNNESIEALTDLFLKQGYELCKDGEFEKDFRKIALYADDENKYTHAARMLRNGIWTSKLGRAFDIQHSTPQIIEGGSYGSVKIFMKKANK